MSLFQDFAARLESALGNNLYSLFLYGAAFFPHPPSWRVDIDFHAILRTAPTKQQIVAVRALHGQLREQSRLGEELDGYYLLLDDARGGGHPRGQVWPRIRDEAWALHRAHIHAGRYTLVRGVDPREFVPVPVWKEFEPDLGCELEFVREESEHPQFGVLNLTRIIYTWTHRDVVVSKYAAAQWGLKHLESKWHSLLAAALRDYEQRPQPDDKQLLAGGFPEFVKFGSAEVKKLIAAYR